MARKFPKLSSKSDHLSSQLARFVIGSRGILRLASSWNCSFPAGNSVTTRVFGLFGVTKSIAKLGKTNKTIEKPSFFKSFYPYSYVFSRFDRETQFSKGFPVDQELIHPGKTLGNHVNNFQTPKIVAPLPLTKLGTWRP